MRLHFLSELTLNTFIMDKKRVYTFGNGQAEGKADMRNLLGGKGANLAEMNLIGVPVPPGFTNTTEVCSEYYELGKDKVVELLKADVEKAIANIENLMNSKFGDVENPLLVSVRSGARASMPGMMDTILNLGLNDEVVEGLSRKTGRPRFAWDFYNSFVIQPMLLDVMEQNVNHFGDGAPRLEAIRLRMRRYAAVLERLIAPDGSFPVIGRSIAYRCGAFQALAQMALRGELPESLASAAVREAMTAVIRRTLNAPGTFDSSGWLRIGLCGHQPGLGENYISTGSLYLASAAFLPLGLPPENAFWSAPAEKWTSVRVWSGEDFPADHAVQG